MSYVQNIVKNVADYAGQLFNDLKEHADWVVANREGLGDFSACLLLLQLLIRARQLYEDIVYFLTMLMLTGAVRATARIYMVESDKELIEALADQGLVHPDRAENAKTVLETEAQKIYDRWTVYTSEFTNAVNDVKNLRDEALAHILNRYTEVGCGGVLSV